MVSAIKNRSARRTDERRKASVKTTFPTWQGFVAMMLSVFLVMFCFPGKPWPWLVWIALAPLFWALRQSGPRQGFLFGGAFGWLVWLTSIWWLQSPFRDIMGLSPFVSLLIVVLGCGLCSVPYFLGGWLVCRWPRRPGILGAARDAAIFTVVTSWLGIVFHGSIAHSQYRSPMVLQILDLGGAPLLLFAIYWVNCLFAEAVGLWKQKSAEYWKPLATIAGVALAIVFYGQMRLSQFAAAIHSATAAQRLAVGIIQPNIPILVAPERQPASRSAMSNDFFSAMEQSKSLARAHPEIELLALPENPDFFPFNSDQKRREALAAMIAETGKPVLVNVSLFDNERKVGGDPGRYNVTVFLDGSAEILGSYRKIKRLPIVEYLPWEKQLPWLRKIFPRSLRVLDGPGPVLFEIKPGVRVIPSICYESTLSSFTRQFIRQGGNVIVNQVNDSWFLRTPASEIHLALAVFRAVEFRVPLVRVTNSGISAHIQADGRILPDAGAELFVEAERVYDVYIPPQRSLYARFGDWFLIGLTLLLVVVFGARFFKRPGTRTALSALP